MENKGIELPVNYFIGKQAVIYYKASKNNPERLYFITKLTSIKRHKLVKLI